MSFKIYTIILCEYHMLNNIVLLMMMLLTNISHFSCLILLIVLQCLQNSITLSNKKSIYSDLAVQGEYLQ